MRGHLVAPICLALAVAACGVPEEEPAIVEQLGEAVSAVSVLQAASSSCTTTSVKALSEQIVAQSNCISPGAFVLVPAAPNLSLGAAVFPYLEEPAKDAFVAALAAKPGTDLQVNSMLRTVAQQYLLYRWYLDGACGIGLAAKPGGSNHETGLAVDIQQYGTWKTALSAVGFKWYGEADAVHFDYVGAGAVDYKGTDVLAFQQLWNANNPGDLIDADGAYGPQTEARLEQSPADGFPIGASCNPIVPAGPNVHPTIAIEAAPDVLSDHGSAGIADLFEGDTAVVTMTLVNKGGSAATSVDVGLWIEEPFLVAADYLIESDWTHPGTFTENDANTDPANPPHGAPLGGTFTLAVQALSPGETKRITLELRAEKYSIGLAGAPDVRLWVKDVPGVYHQEAFGEAPSLSKGQTFGGGTLEVVVEADVYSRTHWEWDSDRLEGWTATGAATIATDPAAKVLLAGGDGQAPGIASPATTFSAADFGAITLRARRVGGTGAAKLYFATEDDPTMTEDTSLDVDLPDDEAFHTVTLLASSHPKWTGAITALRLDPFESGPGSVEVDYLRAVKGGSDVGAGGGGDGDGDGGGGGDGGDAPAEASCSCRIPGAAGATRLSGPWAVMLMAAAFARARLTAARRAAQRYPHRA